MDQRLTSYTRNIILALGVCLSTLQSSANFVTCQDIWRRASSEESIFSQINSLKDGDPLPQEILKSSDSRIIGKAIVKRIRKMAAKKYDRSSEIQYDFEKNSQIVLFFPFDKLDPIIEKGFLNKHQLGGGIIAKMHLRAENVLSGLNLTGGDSEKINYVLPKYAFLDLTGDVVLDKRFLTDDTVYGNVMAVMKDSVKERSTWTYNDSLLLAQEITPDIARKSFMGTFDRGSLEVHQPGGYFEAQIWGALDFSEVKFLGIDKNFPESDINKLKSARVPIYRMERIIMEGRITYKQSQLLWTPF